MLEFLQRDPWGFVQFMLYRAPAVLLALTLHEWAHGRAALKAGDSTAQRMGRLTLNPLRHLDPLGTVFLFLLGFGWARPVPVNPHNFRRGARDDLIVSLAGVTVNFLLFVAGTVAAILAGRLLYSAEALSYYGMDFFLSFEKEGFTIQLFPQYAEALAPALRLPWLLHLQRFLLHFCLINLGLCLFNLLPIPPLDGFHVLNDIVFRGRLRLDPRVWRIAQGLLFALLFFTDLVGDLIRAAIGFVQGLVLSGALAVFGP